MTSRPDFIIPGASKSGTTSLYHYLDEHQNIFLPDGKEIHFFDRNINYRRGTKYYESNFVSTDNKGVSGEITPSYFYKNIIYDQAGHDGYRWNPDDDAPSRIYNHYPDLKIILTLRNPITRSYSQFWKNYRQGRERLDSFSAAIRAELNEGRAPEYHPSCWVYRNRYSEHVSYWLDLFDREQILIIIFEEWIANTESTLNKICDFLEVESQKSWSQSDTPRNVGGQPRVVALNRLYQDYIQGTLLGRKLQRARITHVLDKLNSTKGYPEMSEEARRLLSDEFEPMFDELEEMLGRDLNVWRQELV